MDFIAGSWVDPASPDGAIEDRSPADLSLLLGRYSWAVSEVDRALAAARAAQPTFASVPQAERTQLVRRIGAVLKEREEDLARAIALDVGKPLWEARTEAQACSAKAAITADEGSKLVSTFPAPGQAGAECRFRPLGVLAAIVLGDADPDKAAYDVLFSAFVSAGQRCTAASRAIVVGDARRFARRIAQLAQHLSIGHPFDQGVFMGPLASPAALEKFEQGLAAARAETLLQSRRLEPRGLVGCYLTPSVHFLAERRNSAYEREELFGPDLAVYPAASEEEAVRIANATDYGLAASVHTRDAAAFDRCQQSLECGVVSWNAPTVGASGRLPFGGLKRSGNHRPAGLWSPLYCAAPVAVLRGEAGLAPQGPAPGRAGGGERGGPRAAWGGTPGTTVTAKSRAGAST